VLLFWHQCDFKLCSDQSRKFSPVVIFCEIAWPCERSPSAVAYLVYGRHGTCHKRRFDGGTKIAWQKLKFVTYSYFNLCFAPCTTINSKAESTQRHYLMQGPPNSGPPAKSDREVISPGPRRHFVNNEIIMYLRKIVDLVEL